MLLNERLHLSGRRLELVEEQVKHLILFLRRGEHEEGIARGGSDSLIGIQTLDEPVSEHHELGVLAGQGDLLDLGGGGVGVGVNNLGRHVGVGVGVGFLIVC